MRRAGVATLCLVQFVDVLGVTSVTTAIPALLRGVRAAEADAGLLATVYAMFFGGLLVVGGRLGDRYGHRRVLVAGIVAFGAVSALGATAAGLLQVLAARALQGAAAAVSVPAALRLLLELAPDDVARRRGLAAWSASGGAAGAAGFLLGGVLVQALGWRSVFWVNAPLAVLLLLGALLLVPAGPAPARADRLDLAGAALLVAAVMTLVVGASRFEEASGRPLGGLLVPAGLLLGAAFALRQRRAAAPLLPADALRSAPLRLGTGLSFLNTATTSSAAVLATLVLQQRLGASPVQAGFALLPVSVGAVVGGAAAGPLGGRLPPRTLAALGLAGIALGVALLPLATAAAWAVPVGAGVTGLGLGVASVAANGIGTDVPAAIAGSATGVLNTGAQLGTALGVAVLVVVAALLGPEPAWGITAATAAAAAVLLLARRPARAT